MSDFEKFFNEFNEATDHGAGEDDAALHEQAPAQDSGDQVSAHTSAGQDQGQARSEQDGAPQGDSGPGQEQSESGDDDAAPADPAARESDPETEELRKKAANHDSMHGRLKREQEALEELRRKAQQSDAVMEQLRKVRDERARLEQAMRQEQPQTGPAENQPPVRGQGQAQQPLPMAEIPEDIKDDAATLSREYPDLTPLLHYPGREGEKLRKLIADYGPDMAAAYGQTVMMQYRLAQSESQVQSRVAEAQEMARKAREDALQQIENERRANHFNEVGAKHPEALWAHDPEKSGEYADFRRELDEWVMDRPFREAQQIQQVLAQGTAPDVIAVLDKFKQSKAAPTPKADNGNAARAEDERRRLAQAAAAVPGRHGTPRPAGSPRQADDFSSAWQEANRH